MLKQLVHGPQSEQRGLKRLVPRLEQASESPGRVFEHRWPGHPSASDSKGLR